MAHSTSRHSMDDQMADAIVLANECHDTCLMTITYCLEQGGEHAAPEHIRLMLDCVDICRTAAAFMLRDSALEGRVCAVCAEVCDACAADCERFTGDERMQACAEVCRRCAESCRQMAASAA